MDGDNIGECRWITGEGLMTKATSNQSKYFRAFAIAAAEIREFADGFGTLSRGEMFELERLYRIRLQFD
jgi:hypothetical protein